MLNSILVTHGSGLLSVTRAFGLPAGRAKELATLNRSVLRKVGVSGVEAPAGTRLQVPASWPAPCVNRSEYKVTAANKFAAVGTVWQPNDIAAYFGPLVAGAVAGSNLPVPQIPGNPGALLSSVTNLATALYASLAPGAAPPSPPIVGADFLSTALGWISKYGIGTATPAGVSSPWDVTQYAPALAALRAQFATFLGQQPGIAGTPPSGVTPANWLAGVANAAAYFQNALAQITPNVPMADWVKTAATILQSYAPGATLANNPPSPPPAIYDCGIIGWHFDPTAGKCVPDPGAAAPPKIGPQGCQPGFVADPAFPSDCIPAQPAGAPPLPATGQPVVTPTNKGAAPKSSPWPWILGGGAALAVLVAALSSKAPAPKHAR